MNDTPRISITLMNALKDPAQIELVNMLYKVLNRELPASAIKRANMPDETAAKMGEILKCLEER